MPKFKNIRIKKKGGGSRMQRVQVLASGKYKFVKNTTKSRSPRSSPRKKATRKGVRRMPKKRKGRRRNGFTIPLALVAGVGGSLARPVMTAVNTQDYQLALWQLCEGFTGYYPGNNTWELGRLKFGMLPLIVGAVAHKAASFLGINRTLAQSRIPFIRV